MEIAAEAARRTVGDLLEARHPTFAALATAGVLLGGALLLIGMVALPISREAKLAWWLVGIGGAVTAIDAVVTIAVAIAVVFPVIGWGICALAVVGLGVGLLLRRRA